MCEAEVHSQKGTRSIFPILVVASLLILASWILLNPDTRCRANFSNRGYIEVRDVGRSGRALRYIDEFRDKTKYPHQVTIFASPLDEAFSTENPCLFVGEAIVMYASALNEWDDEELRGLLGHEFGHKLAKRHYEQHRVHFDGNSAQGQAEADGYGAEVAGDRALIAFYIRDHWDKASAHRHLIEGKKALANLRKRLPL